MIFMISLGWYSGWIWVGIEQMLNGTHGTSEAFAHIEDVYRNRKHDFCVNVLVFSMSTPLWINISRIPGCTGFHRYPASLWSCHSYYRAEKRLSLCPELSLTRVSLDWGHQSIPYPPLPCPILAPRGVFWSLSLCVACTEISWFRMHPLTMVHTQGSYMWNSFFKGPSVSFARWRQ